MVELFRGTLAMTSVYPREVVKVALAKNAATAILAHYHPSGAAEPSRADEYLDHHCGRQPRCARSMPSWRSLTSRQWGSKVPIGRAIGRPSYHLAVLLKLFIYGYLNRIPSSRQLER